jgi:hypothetical protein
MSHVSDDQAEWFAANYGVANMKTIRACLLIINKEPGVIQKDGTVINADAVSYLRQNRALSFDRGTPDLLQRLRIRAPGTKSMEQPAASLQVEVYNEEKRRWEGQAPVALPVFKLVQPGNSHPN